MKDSTRRALRTVYQGLIAAIPVVAVFALFLRDQFTEGSKVYVFAGTLVAVTGVVTKLINVLEAAGVIPAFWKAPAATPANPDPETPPDEPGV